MADQWDEYLRCPQCRNTGTASFSQNNDTHVVKVERVTVGFKAVQTQYGPDLHCEVCNVVAVHLISQAA